MEFVLPKARALVARSVHIKIRPAPETFSERREVLRVLERFGEVVAFRSFKYHYTHPVHNAFSALFTTETSAAELIRRSPIRYRLTSEAVQSIQHLESAVEPVAQSSTVSSAIQSTEEPSKTKPVPIQQQNSRGQKQGPTWGRPQMVEAKEGSPKATPETEDTPETKTSEAKTQDSGAQQLEPTDAAISHEVTQIEAKNATPSDSLPQDTRTLSPRDDNYAPTGEEDTPIDTSRHPPLDTSVPDSSKEGKTYSKVFELNITAAVFDHLRYIKGQAMHGPFIPVDPKQSYIASSLKESVPESLWSDGLIDWETEKMKWKKDMVFEQAAGFDQKDDVTAAWRIATRRRKMVEKDTPDVMKDLAGVARRYNQSQQNMRETSAEG